MILIGYTMGLDFEFHNFKLFKFRNQELNELGRINPIKMEFSRLIVQFDKIWGVLDL